MTKYIIETKKPITACMSFEDDQEDCPFCGGGYTDDSYHCQHPEAPDGLENNTCNTIAWFGVGSTKPDWCPLEEIEESKEEIIEKIHGIIPGNKPYKG